MITTNNKTEAPWVGRQRRLRSIVDSQGIERAGTLTGWTMRTILQYLSYAEGAISDRAGVIDEFRLQAAEKTIRAESN